MDEQLMKKTAEKAALDIIQSHPLQGMHFGHVKVQVKTAVMTLHSI